MFGVGLPEIAVIALVAIVALGPDRLPELARQAAQFIHKVRQLANNARDDLRTELGPGYSDLELRDLHPRNIVRKHIAEAMSEVDMAELTKIEGIDTPARVPEGKKPPYDVEAT